MWAGAGDRQGKTAVLGSNYRISQISAALLLNQLKRLDEQIGFECRTRFIYLTPWTK
jgi:dTDP-4-amino-4,6-dideoxygalactose transaminase